MKSFLSVAAALAVVAQPAFAAPKVCADCIRDNMQRLAGPEFNGRACGTADENAAAKFLAERLQSYGVKGGTPAGDYLQSVQFRVPTYAAAPTLEAGALKLTLGQEFLAFNTAPSLEGPLARVALADTEAAAGKIAIFNAPIDQKSIAAFFKAGALAVIVPAAQRYEQAWAQLAERGPGGVEVIGAEEPPAPARTLIMVRPDTMAALEKLEGQQARFLAPRGSPQIRTTYNVMGMIQGTGPDADAQSILLTSHYDHLGVVAGTLYPGANDDASGTAAVLEFARLLGADKAQKRTVRFAMFGCEEAGGHGATYFLAHPPAPLGDIAANLEFEMIGLPDPAHPKTLMLTGWERSNLGPTLKIKGADIGPDHYPEENFFQRSDNYQLAKKGVVAQTVSAWALPPTYHQPTDDLAHVDLKFMAEVVQSLVAPLRWLADSDFRPEWNPGQKP